MLALEKVRGVDLWCTRVGARKGVHLFLFSLGNYWPSRSFRGASLFPDSFLREDGAGSVKPRNPTFLYSHRLSLFRTTTYRGYVRDYVGGYTTRKRQSERPFDPFPIRGYRTGLVRDRQCSSGCPRAFTGEWTKDCLCFFPGWWTWTCPGSWMSSRRGTIRESGPTTEVRPFFYPQRFSSDLFFPHAKLQKGATKNIIRSRLKIRYTWNKTHLLILRYRSSYTYMLYSKFTEKISLRYAFQKGQINEGDQSTESMH